MKSQTIVARLITTLLALALLLAGCAPAATPTPTPQPAPTVAPLPPTAAATTLSAEAEAVLQPLAKGGSFGGSVLVAQNGQVILSQGYGFADRAKKTPNTAQTKIRIAQLTQGFTAMAILLLQERGKLNVQDKLCTYLPGCPDSWKPITLHQLLIHTSGIPDARNFFQSLDPMIAEAKTQPLDFEPGGQWGFSHTGYNLLGKVIEVVSGQSYETFLQKNIFEPLQMSSTGYDHNQADLAVGYPNSGDQASNLMDPQGLFASGALYSTVEDLYRWDQALYTDKLVSQKALDAMFTAYIPIPAMPAWSNGYGYSVRPTGPRMIEGAGGIAGFSSVVHRYPDDKVIVILLANQENANPWEIADSVSHKLFGE